MLFADALSFIGVYLAYALVSAGFSSGFLPKSGFPVILAFALFIVDRMSMQMGMIRSLYLRAIALTVITSYSIHYTKLYECFLCSAKKIYGLVFG